MVEEEEANFGLIISFVLGSLCSREKEGIKEDKGKLGSSLSRSRFGNYPNSLFVYVWVRKNLTLIIKVFWLVQISFVVCFEFILFYI